MKNDCLYSLCELGPVGPRMRSLAVSIAAILCLCILLDDARGQEVGRVGSVTATGVPYKVFAEKGEPTIRVKVVGGPSAGIYEVGHGTRFDEFLALTSVSPSTTTERARQTTTLHLYRQRDGTGERTLVLEGRVQSILARDPDQYPSLQHQDLLQVEVHTEGRFGWRDVLDIVGAAASIVLVAERAGMF